MQLSINPNIEKKQCEKVIAKMTDSASDEHPFSIPEESNKYGNIRLDAILN